MVHRRVHRAGASRSCRALPPSTMLAFCRCRCSPSSSGRRSWAPRGQARAIAMIDLETARLHLAFGALLVAGVVLSARPWLTSYGPWGRRGRSQVRRDARVGLAARTGRFRRHVPRSTGAVLAAHDGHRARSAATRSPPAGRRDGADRSEGGGARSRFGGVLYATFWVGDRVRRRIVPSGDRDIRGDLRAAGAPAARRDRAAPGHDHRAGGGALLARPRPAGLHGSIRPRAGHRAGGGAYGGVHVVTGNFTLLGAAGVAGA